MAIISRRRLQVFISSTYEDMISERQAAVTAILRARHIPAGMELFAAGDESQWETIKQWIDQSDVFLLLVGVRYSLIDPATGLSYTEKEYWYAVQNNKPIIAMYMADDAATAKISQLGTKVLQNNDSTKLQAFLVEVKRRHCRAFDSLDKIQVEVAFGLIEVAEDDRVVGWVQASDVPSVLALEQENATLKKRCTDLEVKLETRPRGRDESDNEEFPQIYDKLMGLRALGASQANLFSAFWIHRDYLLEGYAPEDQDRRWLSDLVSFGLVSAPSYRGQYNLGVKGKRFVRWVLSKITSGEFRLHESTEPARVPADSEEGSCTPDNQ